MWRDTLRQIVAFYKAGCPLRHPTFLYEVDAPNGSEWPESLPTCDGLRDFHCICGGGEFGPMIRFISQDNLAAETSRWIELLRDYDERGDVLIAGRHVVFANDADGTPWVWDSQTGKVSSFYWKGGDWEEPGFASFDDFMEFILSPQDDDPDWAEALAVFTKDSQQ